MSVRTLLLCWAALASVGRAQTIDEMNAATARMAAADAAANAQVTAGPAQTTDAGAPADAAAPGGPVAPAPDEEGSSPAEGDAPALEELPPLLPAPQFSFANPFSQYADGAIPGWQYGGEATLTNDYMTLTPASPGATGWAWMEEAVAMPAWEAQIDFHIGGAATRGAGGGMAFWFTAQQGRSGPIYGHDDHFEGLGIFFDTYEGEDGATPYHLHHRLRHSLHLYLLLLHLRRQRQRALRRGDDELWRAARRGRGPAVLQEPGGRVLRRVPQPQQHRAGARHHARTRAVSHRCTVLTRNVRACQARVVWAGGKLQAWLLVLARARHPSLRPWHVLSSARGRSPLFVAAGVARHGAHGQVPVVPADGRGRLAAADAGEGLLRAERGDGRPRGASCDGACP